MAFCVALWVAGAVPAQPLVGIAGEVAPQAAAQGTRDIHHLFQHAVLGPSARPATIAINFTPAAWHVGSLDGPVATAAQLTSVLGALERIVVTGRCTDAGVGTPNRPCAFRLGDPDFAGIVNPDAEGTVFGWVATARSTRPGVGQVSAAAMRYFGLLSPTRYAGPSGSGATIALRYDAAARTLMPAGFDTSGATMVLHGRRLPPLPALALRGTP